MNKKQASTLSEHLLGEVNRYLVYPDKLPRGVRPSDGRFGIDETVSAMAERRRTFAPEGYGFPDTPEKQARLWNDVYCRELLRQVPAMVERTQALEPLLLDYDQDTPPAWVVHLREAAKCLLVRLPTATLALARAAVEVPLRDLYAKATSDDKNAYDPKTTLGIIIGGLSKFQVLSSQQTDWANEVREAANTQLHARPTDPLNAREEADLKEAMRVYESARKLLVSLEEKRTRGRWRTQRVLARVSSKPR